jgi:formate dehydrogenase subunit gamma
MAVDPRLAIAALPRVQRFGATERRLHTIHAWAFSVLLLTGFVLYLPFLAQIVSDRPLMKGIHLVTAVAWLTALALVAVLGDGAAMRQTRRDIERFDADDVLFVRTRGRSRTAGRFNGGQKAHAIAQAGLTVLFTVSGVLLYLGERDTAFRLPGTIALHDAATLLLAVLVAGHIMQATSHPQSLEGIRRGTVRASYAAAHHPRWDAVQASADPETGAGAFGVGRIALATGIVALGVMAITQLV